MFSGPGRHLLGRRSTLPLGGYGVLGTSLLSYRHWGRCLAIISTSLSPLPERLTMIESLVPRFFANFIEKLIAWADSKAGMIPSSCERFLNASRASSSDTVTYLARPVVIRKACSGPTPG